MKKLKETTSHLLNRTRVEFEIDHFQRSTPTKANIQQQLAKELKVDEAVIHLKHIFSHFGSSKSKIIADVYKTKEDYKKYVNIKKKKGEKTAQPAPAEAKKEIPKEKTETPEKKEEPKPKVPKKEAKEKEGEGNIVSSKEELKEKTK